jgi:hypothetical protein
LRQLAGDPESRHPSSVMSICSDWKLQPLSHRQVMNLTCFGGNLGGAETPNIAAHADPTISILALRLS